MPSLKQIELGKRLKYARSAAGLTQEEVAEAIGSHTVTISKYERGVQDPNTELLQEMAKLYEVTADWLLGGDRELSIGALSKQERDLLAVFKLLPGDRRETLFQVAEGFLWQANPRASTETEASQGSARREKSA